MATVKELGDELRQMLHGIGVAAPHLDPTQLAQKVQEAQEKLDELLEESEAS